MWGSLGDKLAELGDDLSRRAHSATHNQPPPHQDARNLVESARQRLEENQEANKSSDEKHPDGDTTSSQEKQTAVDTNNGESSELATNNNNNNNEPVEQEVVPPQLPRWASSFANTVSNKQQQENMIGSLRNWTQNVVESTKHIVNETRETLEKEQARIQATAPSLFHRGQGGGPYKRDPSLPLDVEALRDAEVVYITDRIVTLSHPYMQSTTDGDIIPDRKLAAVGQLLQRRHGGRYMVWNLSEVEYEASILDDQVLVYKFPGSPSPPLGLLLKLLLSVESWLKADERNVAVLHCLTGRGRTSTVLAAFLCWTGEAGFTDVNGALKYIARCKRVSVDALTIPSQVRYCSYFANMLDGVRPSQPPLLLKRIIMSEAPKFGKRMVESSAEEGGDANNVASGDSSHAAAGGGGGDALLGCAPYLQIFKAGTLIFTTAASVNYAQTKDDLPFVSVGDGPVSFVTEAVVQGDILLRCRHLTRSGQRVSMFRCAFHTGYVPPKVLRLTKAQLDGACGDKRFSDDFFLDLIFEPCDEATASKHLMSNQEKTGTNNNNTATSGNIDEAEGGAANEAAQRRSMGTVSNGNTVSASAYDSMLHRDSRFWDVIAKRREENMKKLADLEKSGGMKDESKKDIPLSGPTIGRRREFPPKQPSSSSDAPAESAADSDDNRINDSAKTKPHSMRSSMNAFSIGEEFGLGFESSSSEPTPSSKKNVSKPPDIPASPPAPKKPDALMEALMGLEEDVEDDEEVDFSSPLPEAISESSESNEVANDAAAMETPSEPTAVETKSIDSTAEADSAFLKTEAEDKDDSKPTDGTVVDSEKSGGAGGQSSVVQNESILSDFADDLANLDVVDDDDGIDLDVDDFEDFGDFDEDDAELEDLENFLTQVSTK